VSVANLPLSEAQLPQVLKLPAAEQPLHRLAEVRELQGVSRRTVARRLGTGVAQVKHEEHASTDLPLSRLYEWQEALEVPVGELLAEAQEGLARPVQQRAQLVRIMKTASAISERANHPSLKRLAQNLIEQLLELMPELEGVGPWHAVGKRRRRDELGIAAERRLSDDVFFELAD